MKGQLICDWPTTRNRWVQWVKGPIKVARKVRYYGRLAPTEGRFVDVELE